MTNRRGFLRKAGLVGAGAVGASTLAAPYVRAQSPIKWRLQTYAGAPLGAYVIQPAVEAFNKAANGEMEIELYFADQLVPQGELFRAVQQGTLDAAQSDDDSMGSPADVAVFGAYFPFATLFSLDVPALFHNYGLNEIWQEAYADTGVTWLGAGAWDPCNLGTTQPVRSLADLQGKRIFTFPTAGRFLAQFGVIPVVLPYEDVQVAVQTGEVVPVRFAEYQIKPGESRPGSSGGGSDGSTKKETPPSSRSAEIVWRMEKLSETQRRDLFDRMEKFKRSNPTQNSEQVRDWFRGELVKLTGNG